MSGELLYITFLYDEISIIGLYPESGLPEIKCNAYIKIFFLKDMVIKSTEGVQIF